MNFLTAGSKFNKELEKSLSKLKNELVDDDNIFELNKMIIENILMKKMENDMRRGIQLMMMFKDISKEMGLLDNNNKLTNTFFITIRPDEKKIKFLDFKINMINLLKRKCFINIYIATLEQKGTTIIDMGRGFHFHIISKMSQRSKTEVLRDLFNSVKNYTALNCINVKIINNETEYNNAFAYLNDYTSADGHKNETKEIDKIWRLYEDIKDLSCPSVKFVEGHNETSKSLDFN